MYQENKSLKKEFAVKDDKGVRYVVIVMQCIGKKELSKNVYSLLL